jgi:predicted Zn-dependent peptidase
MIDYELHTLANGIRIVHKRMSHTKVVHCGFMLNIGSRDEPKEMEGIAHFWEHMAFKGTNKRRAFHILNRLDAVGGELNAYTTKEKITFHASVLDGHFEKAVELLSDITFDSIFPEKQIVKERQVILEEMAMYQDTPEDAIQDEFDHVVFGDHPMGVNILGRPETINKFKKRDFQEFINNNMNTEEIVFTSVGNISMKKVVKLAEKYFAHIPHLKVDRVRTKINAYLPRIKQVKRQITQSLCVIGRPAYAADDANRLPFFLLMNLLGGPGMNSRLNLSLREKHGLVYAIDTSYSSYSDTGLFGIHFGTEPRQLQKSITLVKRELEKLQKTTLGVRQLQASKEQLIGQLAMSEENNASLMLAMGKSMLDKNRIDSLEEIYAKIRKVNAGQIQDVAVEMFDDSTLSMLTYIPE